MFQGPLQIERRSPSCSPPLPELCSISSAKAWAIASLSDGRLLASKSASTRREMASITKVMTCYVAISYLCTNKLSLFSWAPVTKRAASTNGTTANLKKGERIRVWDLLHALMLPSGNDAATCVAEYIGNKMLKTRERRHGITEPVRCFISEMNAAARWLSLHETFYTNAHGMSGPKNTSSVRDIVSLCSVAMQNELFRKIVSCEDISCYIQRRNRSLRVGRWENTNQLLGKGFSGIKTGTTPRAGPCLCACSDSGVLVVVLGCHSASARWSEVRAMAELGLTIMAKDSARRPKQVM